MAKPAAFRRPHHRRIAQILGALDGALLLERRCFFGGGTLLALSLGEYRESRDIDFLCSDRTGFRRIREAVRVDSLGTLARREIPLAREVRADRDGIRTFVAAGDEKVKLEIILEARIDLEGVIDRRLGVPVLRREHLAAEKLLANADRGLDESTHARDAIDLAFLAARVGAGPIEAGFAIARAAYGDAIGRGFEAVLSRLTTRKRYVSECAQALGIEDVATLKRGLATLRKIARQRR